MICVGVWGWDYTPIGTSLALLGRSASSSLMGMMRKRILMPSCLNFNTIGSEKSSRSFWTSSTVQTEPSGRPWLRHRCFKLNKILRAMFCALSPRNALIRFFVQSRHQWRLSRIINGAKLSRLVSPQTLHCMFLGKKIVVFNTITNLSKKNGP